MLLTYREREFLAGFIHEAISDPFRGPATEELHRRDIYYTDLSERARFADSNIETNILAEALDEDFLNRVVEIRPEGGAAPAGGEVGANDSEVAVGQLLAVGRAARRGGTNDGPAGGLLRGHGRVAAPAWTTVMASITVGWDGGGVLGIAGAAAGAAAGGMKGWLFNRWIMPEYDKRRTRENPVGAPDSTGGPGSSGSMAGGS